MISADTPIDVPPNSQAALVEYLKAARNAQVRIYNMREHFRSIDLAYQREQDLTQDNQRAKLANKYGDATKFQNVTVPVVMPQVESAVTYQASVFLTGSPLFGVVAEPASMDAAMQMETVIDDQAIRGGWVAELIQVFRDALKYNFYAAEIDWVRERIAELETDLGFSTKEAKPKQINWEGNKLKRLDPYNLLFDMRVPPHEIHKRGEFAGYTQLMSRMELKSFLAQLDGKILANVKPALESALGNTIISTNSETAPYYVPMINPEIYLSRQIEAMDFDWMQWAGVAGSNTGIQYRNAYQVTTLYARILPEDFKLRVPNRATPQVWKFIYVNDSVLILAERQTNAHNFLPILCGQGQVDGLSYQTKSLASNVTPIQQLASANWNSIIATQRRSITDRVLYDPSRISEHHINNSNPAAKIPVRPSAYGKPVAESVYAFPFRSDNLDNTVAIADRIEQMADKSTRNNPVNRGQFVKGNKTRSEFDSVMSNANGEDQMVAMQFEANLFTPLKEIIKLNILQFQQADSLLNRAQDQLVPIDPIALRQAVMAFKVSDGLLPSEKIISGDAIRDGFQTLANMPQLAAGYNLAPFFSYMMKIQGAKISAFEKPPEQLAYEQAVAQWQQLVLQMAQANKEITPQQFPPQPTPEQFGWNPQQQVTNNGEQVNGSQAAPNQDATSTIS